MAYTQNSDHNSWAIQKPFLPHILMVGKQTADTFKPLVKSLNLPTRITIINSGREALNLLSQIHVDVLIVDQFIPDLTGAQFIQTIRQQGLDKIYTVLLIPDEVYGRVLSFNSRFEIDMFVDPSKDPLLNLPLLRQALNGRVTHSQNYQ